MTQLDQAIDAAHNEAERIENDARAIEARIIKAGALPPARPYGRPVDPAAIAKNLTLRSVLQRRDPALAAYLGVGSDLQRRRDEEEATRALQAESLRMKTEQARQQNQDAAARRYRQQMAPLPTGWRS
jgi:hypothetical protein